MLKWTRQFCISMILVAALGWLTGCNLDSPVGGLSNEGSPNLSDGNEPSSAGAPEPSNEALPDFSLTDVNSNSSRFGEAVSPRDYLGKISAWYFGHAT